MKNLKLVLAVLALVALGFAICKFVDRRHENVRIQNIPANQGYGNVAG